MIVLSGDIGGTTTRLQLTECSNPLHLKTIAREKYANSSHLSFSDIIQKFLNDAGKQYNEITSACFAVAGPIINGTVKFTNLPWFIEEAKLKAELKIDKVKLINDFQAVGYGVEILSPEDVYVLQEGRYQLKQVKAIIGAGTGLGMGMMHWDGMMYEVSATEGGHADFAPTTDAQIALLQYLRKKYHRVSVERLVSGPGIINLYSFVKDNPLPSEKEDPELHFALHKNEDTAATISYYAIEKKDPMAMRALELFVQIYGSAAGNLALTTLPYSGLYIAGGIAPKLLSQFTNGRFLEAYSDKGRLSNLLKDIPIYIVLNTHVGLLGASTFAARM
ncbi:MAG: glucokinase [Gammaproteobacteria bacterium]|jgi:glucokinase|nr:glucokinase [Gammaproteobacteria bacterium]